MPKLEMPEWANCWLMNAYEILPARYDGTQFFDKFGCQINTNGYEYEVIWPEQELSWFMILMGSISGAMVLIWAMFGDKNEVFAFSVIGVLFTAALFMVGIKYAHENKLGGE